MKAYTRPRIRVETVFGTDELLAINPHPVEYSWGTDWTIDHTIPAGDVDLQDKPRDEEPKGEKQVWGDLW